MTPIRWLTTLPSRLFGRRNNGPDSRALARDLVGEMDGVTPGFIQVEGLRRLGDMDWPNDKAFEAAVAAFEDELGRLTGRPMAAPRVLPKSAPTTPPATTDELTRIAIELVGQTFSAPFDGSEERIEVLRQRARGRVDGLVASGADSRRIAAAIEETAEELRRAWEH